MHVFLSLFILLLMTCSSCGSSGLDCWNFEVKLSVVPFSGLTFWATNDFQRQLCQVINILPCPESLSFQNCMSLQNKRLLAESKLKAPSRKLRSILDDEKLWEMEDDEDPDIDADSLSRGKYLKKSSKGKTNNKKHQQRTTRSLIRINRERNILHIISSQPTKTSGKIEKDKGPEIQLIPVKKPKSIRKVPSKILKGDYKILVPKHKRANETFIQTIMPFLKLLGLDNVIEGIAGVGCPLLTSLYQQCNAYVSPPVAQATSTVTTAAPLTSLTGSTRTNATTKVVRVTKATTRKPSRNVTSTIRTSTRKSTSTTRSNRATTRRPSKLTTKSTSSTKHTHKRFRTTTIQHKASKRRTTLIPTPFVTYEENYGESLYEDTATPTKTSSLYPDYYDPSPVTVDPRKPTTTKRNSNPPLITTRKPSITQHHGGITSSSIHKPSTATSSLIRIISTPSTIRSVQSTTLRSTTLRSSTTSNQAAQQTTTVRPTSASYNQQETTRNIAGQTSTRVDSTGSVSFMSSTSSATVSTPLISPQSSTDESKLPASAQQTTTELSASTPKQSASEALATSSAQNADPLTSLFTISSFATSSINSGITPADTNPQYTSSTSSITMVNTNSSGITPGDTNPQPTSSTPSITMVNTNRSGITPGDTNQQSTSSTLSITMAKTNNSSFTPVDIVTQQSTSSTSSITTVSTNSYSTLTAIATTANSSNSMLDVVRTLQQTIADLTARISQMISNMIAEQSSKSSSPIFISTSSSILQSTTPPSLSNGSTITVTSSLPSNGITSTAQPPINIDSTFALIQAMQKIIADLITNLAAMLNNKLSQQTASPNNYTDGSNNATTPMQSSQTTAIPSRISPNQLLLINQALSLIGRLQTIMTSVMGQIDSVSNMISQLQ